MITLNNRSIRLALLGAVVLAILAAALVFGGVTPPFYAKERDLSAYGPPSLDYRIVQFAELGGWFRDNVAEALPVFVRSCDQIETQASQAPANPQEYLGDLDGRITLSGAVADWLQPCAEARTLLARTSRAPEEANDAARLYFEMWFAPIEVIDRRAPLPGGPARREKPRIDATGRFTGYYEPTFPASRLPTATFSAPVYSRPDDLVDVDLGAFRKELSGQRIAGRIDGRKLIPYPDYKAIDAGALAGRADPLAWMAPNDLFFLQIQGSGRLAFEDGGGLRVGYAGQNGRPYTAIGKVMAERGVMPLADISMQSIRNWLDAAEAPAAQAMREENASYVFFEQLGDIAPTLGPLGAEGAPLTPQRSLAVDRRFHALGAPVWVDIEAQPDAGLPALRRLMVAQDTGGAIKGPVRGDVFWGTGAVAGEMAGKMNARGRLYVLVPRTVAARLPQRRRP